MFTQIANAATSQQGNLANPVSFGQLYPKDAYDGFNKKLIFDNYTHDLLLQIADILGGDEINYHHLLPLIIDLKRYLRRKNIFTTYSWNEVVRFRNRLAIHECLQDVQYNRHSFAINNISNLISKQNDGNFKKYFDEIEIIPFLHWLQDKVFFSQVLNNECYTSALTDIDKFKKRSRLNYFDQFFRFVIAFNTGIGTSCTVFNYGPVALAGILTLFNVTLPPLGILLTTIAFGIVAVGFSMLLIKSMMRTYSDEDSKLEKSVHNSENEIYYLAHQEVKLRKHRYELQHKNLRYIAGLQQNYQPTNVTHNLVHADINPNEDDENDKPAALTWLRVTLSSIGTIGTVWGVPNMILGLFGVSLFLGGVLSPPGIALAVGALIIAGVVGYQAYRYEKKSTKCKNELDKIKQDGIKNINKHIFDEEKAMLEAALENENLKQQHMKNIVQLDSTQERLLQQEAEAISDTTLPIDLSVAVDNRKDGKVKHRRVVKDVTKTQSVINEILTGEQYPSVQLGVDLKKNGTLNVVVGGINANDQLMDGKAKISGSPFGHFKKYSHSMEENKGENGGLSRRSMYLNF